jgi:ribonuclease Z
MSNLKPSNIKKIFLTHLHGDHSFGLAGVLCLVGQSQEEERSSSQQVIDIYGPEGMSPD